MFENYSFDEDNKRLKPISGFCSYCGNKVTDDSDTNFYIKVHKEKKTALFSLRSTFYRKYIFIHYRQMDACRQKK